MEQITKNNLSNSIVTINILVVILVSCNLRAPITSVGPVLNQIRNSLQLNNFQGSLLTSIPLAIFALCSILISRFIQRVSTSRFLFYAMALLSFGLFLRVYGSNVFLFIGSIFIGLGICIGNVVTPGYIKNNFPKQIGLMTGIFAIVMSLTAAFASGYSISIGQWTGLGWRGSLGIWGILALLTMFVILIELFTQKNKNCKTEGNTTNISKPAIIIFKSSQAWAISIFMGLQSLVFYSLITWLPAVLNDYGMTENQSGWILFVIQISMIPTSFIGPVIAYKMHDQRLMIPFISLLMLISILMFALLKTNYVYITAILLGISNGLSFSLSILFFSLKTKTSFYAIKVSGMAQSIGYLIAAMGPSIFGKLHDWDLSWKSSFYFICFSIILMFYFGMKAAKRKFIEE